MKTLYIEGLASPMAPSRASAVREGGGEASVGVHAGGVIEPRNLGRLGCRRCRPMRKATPRAALFASCRRTPRGRRTQACVESPGARTGRSDGRPSL